MDGKVDLTEKLSMFSERFAPRTVAEFNGHDVMVAKLEGEFIWHKHDDTDDFFLVLKGRLVLRMRDREDVILGPGDLYVVPRGVEHQPVVEEETHLLLIEPTGTPNTGDARTAAPRRELLARLSASPGYESWNSLRGSVREHPFRPPAPVAGDCTVGQQWGSSGEVRGCGTGDGSRVLEGAHELRGTRDRHGRRRRGADDLLDGEGYLGSARDARASSMHCKKAGNVTEHLALRNPACSAVRPYDAPHRTGDVPTGMGRCGTLMREFCVPSCSARDFAEAREAIVGGSRASFRLVSEAHGYGVDLGLTLWVSPEFYEPFERNGHG